MFKLHVLGRRVDQTRGVGVVGTATDARFGVIVALDVERGELSVERGELRLELLLELADGAGLIVVLRVGGVELAAASVHTWAHNLSHHRCAAVTVGVREGRGGQRRRLGA